MSDAGSVSAIPLGPAVTDTYTVTISPGGYQITGDGTCWISTSSSSSSPGVGQNGTIDVSPDGWQVTLCGFRWIASQDYPDTSYYDGGILPPCVAAPDRSSRRTQVEVPGSPRYQLTGPVSFLRRDSARDWTISLSFQAQDFIGVVGSPSGLEPARLAGPHIYAACHFRAIVGLVTVTANGASQTFDPRLQISRIAAGISGGVYPFEPSIDVFLATNRFKAYGAPFPSRFFTASVGAFGPSIGGFSTTGLGPLFRNLLDDAGATIGAGGGAGFGVDVNYITNSSDGKSGYADWAFLTGGTSDGKPSQSRTIGSATDTSFQYGGGNLISCRPYAPLTAKLTASQFTNSLPLAGLPVAFWSDGTLLRLTEYTDGYGFDTIPNFATVPTYTSPQGQVYNGASLWKTGTTDSIGQFQVTLALYDIRWSVSGTNPTTSHSSAFAFNSYLQAAVDPTYWMAQGQNYQNNHALWEIDCGQAVTITRALTKSVSLTGWAGKALLKAQYPPAETPVPYVPPCDRTAPSAFDATEAAFWSLVNAGDGLHASLPVSGLTPQAHLYALQKDFSTRGEGRAFRFFRYLRLRITADTAGPLRLVLLTSALASYSVFGANVPPVQGPVKGAGWDFQLRVGENLLIADLLAPTALNITGTNTGTGSQNLRDPLGSERAGSGGVQGDSLGRWVAAFDFYNDADIAAGWNVTGGFTRYDTRTALDTQRQADVKTLRLEGFQPGASYVVEEATLYLDTSCGHTPQSAQSTTAPVIFGGTYGPQHLIVTANGRPAAGFAWDMNKYEKFDGVTMRRNDYAPGDTDPRQNAVITPLADDLIAAWNTDFDDGAGVWTVASSLAAMTKILPAAYLRVKSVTNTIVTLNFVLTAALFQPGSAFTQTVSSEVDFSLAVGARISGVWVDSDTQDVSDNGLTVSSFQAASDTVATTHLEAAAQTDIEGSFALMALPNRVYDAGTLVHQIQAGGSSVGSYTTTDRNLEMLFVSAPTPLRNPTNLETEGGQYFRGGAKHGIRVWRTDKPIPIRASGLVSYDLANVAATGTGYDQSNAGRDSEPSFASDWRGRFHCVFMRRTGCSPTYAYAAYETFSDDDGATWSISVMAFSGGKHPVIRTGNDGTLIRAAFVPNADPSTGGTIQTTFQAAGDASPTSPVTLTDQTGATITTVDDTFSLTHARDGAARWVLIATPFGATQPAEWWSADECQTFTSI